ELPSELEALELALYNNSQTKEIYTISQEIALKIGMLTPDQESEFKQLLREFTDLFAKDITQLGRTDLVMHKIYTEDVSLISSRPYSVPITEQVFINEEVQRMLDNKLIKDSTSLWASPVVLV